MREKVVIIFRDSNMQILKFFVLSSRGYFAILMKMIFLAFFIGNHNALQFDFIHSFI